MAISPSPLLAGRFRMIKPLGTGGFGTVYLAEDRRGEVVAVKLLNEHLIGNRDEVQRFEREARIGRSIHHPNVVRVIGHGRDGARPFLVMEWVDGHTLDDYLSRNGPLPLEQATPLIRQLLSGLSEIHRHQIFLLDFKPANILIDPLAWTAKVADFGAARAVGEPYLIDGDFAVGTLPYMAPEQRAGEPIGPETDLYALAVVFHEMLTGHKPFNRDADSLDSMPLISAQIPPKLGQIIRRSLAPTPAGRFHSADEMSRAIAAVPAARSTRGKKQARTEATSSFRPVNPVSAPPRPAARHEQKPVRRPRQPNRLTLGLRDRLAGPSQALAEANEEIVRAVTTFNDASLRFEQMVLRIAGRLGLALVIVLILLLVVLAQQGRIGPAS